MRIASSVEKLQRSNPPVAPNSRDHNRPPNGFDGLRLVAAMLVFCSHAFALFGLAEPAVSAAAPAARVTLGTLGVTIFFTLSGYLVTASFESGGRDAGRYALARVLRIYPAFALHVLITIFVVGSLATKLSERAYLAALGAHWQRYAVTSALLLLMPPLIAFGHQTASRRSASSWERRALTTFVCLLVPLLLAPLCDVLTPLPRVFADNPQAAIVNGGLWTLFLEAAMYVVIAIGLTLRARVHRHALVLCIAAWGAAFWQCGAFHYSSVVEWSGLHCCSFLWGSLIFLYRRCPTAESGLALAACVAALVVTRDGPWFVVTYIIAVPYAVIYAAQSRQLAWVGHLTRFGDWSYGVYLYSWPVQQLCRTWLPHSFAAYFMSSLALTLGFAAFSWHSVEKVALRFKPAKISNT